MLCILSVRIVIWHVLLALIGGRNEMEFVSVRVDLSNKADLGRLETKLLSKKSKFFIATETVRVEILLLVPCCSNVACNYALSLICWDDGY